MATIKVILRTEKKAKKKNGRYPLRIRIIQNRKVSYVNIKHYSLRSDQWDEVNEVVLKTHKNYKRLNILIGKKKSEIEEKFLDLEIKNKNLSSPELAEIVKGKKGKDFFAFGYAFAKRYDNEDQQQNYGKYKMVLGELKKFAGKTYMEFQDLTYSFFDRYLQHLITSGKMPGTIDARFNKIRAIWNAAMRSGEVDRNHYPFYELKMPRMIQRKVARLEFTDIEKLKKHKAIKDSNEYHAINSFLFSYSCLGIRAGDLVKIKIVNIIGIRLEYTSNKATKQHSVLLNKLALSIFNEYSKGKEADDFLFPWYEKIGKVTALWQRKNTAVNLYNKYLKLAASDAGIKTKVTTHIARHSWAWHAKLKNVDKKIIKDGLGHSKDATTDAYLERFPSSIMDEANRRVVGK